MEARIDNYGEFTPKTMDKYTCVIADGAVFTGTIECESAVNVAVFGQLIGDVKTTGALEVSGGITGNIHAESFHSDSAKITGNISVEESAIIGSEALILGNIKGTDIEITGAVKGDVDARGKVSLGSTAVIKGNIKSRSMTMEDGAAIDGQCEQCYAEKTADRFFEELEGGVVDKLIENDAADNYEFTDEGKDLSYEDDNENDDEVELISEEPPIEELAASV